MLTGFRQTHLVWVSSRADTMYLIFCCARLASNNSHSSLYPTFTHHRPGTVLRILLIITTTWCYQFHSYPTLPTGNQSLQEVMQLARSLASVRIRIRIQAIWMLRSPKEGELEECMSTWDVLNSRRNKERSRKSWGRRPAGWPCWKGERRLVLRKLDRDSFPFYPWI